MNDALSSALVNGAAPTLAVIVSAGIAWFRGRRAEKQVAEVHLIVNNQRTEMMAQIDSLTKDVARLTAEKSGK